jgi:hypothetical protein
MLMLVCVWNLKSELADDFQRMKQTRPIFGVGTLDSPGIFLTGTCARDFQRMSLFFKMLWCRLLMLGYIIPCNFIFAEVEDFEQRDGSTMDMHGDTKVEFSTAIIKA